MQGKSVGPDDTIGHQRHDVDFFWHIHECVTDTMPYESEGAQAYDDDWVASSTVKLDIGKPTHLGYNTAGKVYVFEREAVSSRSKDRNAGIAR